MKFPYFLIWIAVKELTKNTATELLASSVWNWNKALYSIVHWKNVSLHCIMTEWTQKFDLVHFNSDFTVCLKMGHYCISEMMMMRGFVLKIWVILWEDVKVIFLKWWYNFRRLAIKCFFVDLSFGRDGLKTIPYLGKPRLRRRRY